MKKSPVTVNNPCSQKWDSMNPHGEGRFCESCNKTVVDFTKMNKDEIFSYLKERKDKTCGYFLPHQVEVKRPKHHQFLLNWYEKTQNGITTRFFRNVSLAFIAFCMFLVGCSTPETTTGEIDCVNRDDTTNNYIPMPGESDSATPSNGGHIIGDTTAVYESKTTTIEKVETNILGEIALDPIGKDSVKIDYPDSSETKKEG